MTNRKDAVVMTNYIGYYQGLGESCVQYGTDLEELKKPWCFGMEIFECGEHTAENPIVYDPLPQMPEGLKLLRENFKSVHRDGLMPQEPE